MHRVSVVAATLVVLGLAAGPASVLAADPTVEHFREVGSFTDPDFCGTGEPVDVAFDITGTNFLTPNQDVPFWQAAQAKFRYSNPTTGDTVRSHTAGTAIVEVSSTPSGGFTVLNSGAGLPEQIKTPHGGVLTRDAGYLQLLLTFDSDGNRINSEVLVDRGPHPEAEADLELFCDVMTDALEL